MLYLKLFYNHLFLLFTLSFFAIASPQSVSADVEIVRIESLSEMANEISPTVYLFDIDDTLIDSPHMIGSKQWQQYLKEVEKTSGQPKIKDTLSLFVARNHPIATVEALTVEYIKNLQQKDHVICGFTARERNFWHDLPVEGIDQLTLKQLQTTGISWDLITLHEAIPDLIKVPEYYQGVIFSDMDVKGEYLKKLCSALRKPPKKIIFVDDKKMQIDSVAKTMKELGIDGVCYWYCATVEKANRFNPLIANIQLDYFIASHGKKSLSDEEAAEIARQYPEKDAEYYLQRILNNSEIQELTKP